MASSKVWIGLDGGGTKTKTFVINAEGQLLGEATSGCSNRNSMGFEKAAENVAESVKAALSAAGRTENEVQGICAGLSGCDRDADKAEFTAFFNTLCPGAAVKISNDGVLALASGTRGVLHGIVIISGTGSIAVGFHSKNGPTQVRASGWGPLLGEEGGGYMMGNDCLIAVAREADGRGQATLLTPLVMQKLGLAKAEDLIAWRYADLSFARPASVTPLLFEAAGKGDAVALAILAKSVNGLVESIESVWRNLAFGQEEAVPIVLAGGNLTHEHSILCSELKKKLIERIPTAEILMPVVDPAMAAALLAQNKQ